MLAPRHGSTAEQGLGSCRLRAPDMWRAHHPKTAPDYAVRAPHSQRIGSSEEFSAMGESLTEQYRDGAIGQAALIHGYQRITP